MSSLARVPASLRPRAAWTRSPGPRRLCCALQAVASSVFATLGPLHAHSLPVAFVVLDDLRRGPVRVDGADRASGRHGHLHAGSVALRHHHATGDSSVILADNAVAAGGRRRRGTGRRPALAACVGLVPSAVAWASPARASGVPRRRRGCRGRSHPIPSNGRRDAPELAAACTRRHRSTGPLRRPRPPLALFFEGVMHPRIASERRLARALAVAAASDRRAPRPRPTATTAAAASVAAAPAGTDSRQLPQRRRQLRRRERRHRHLEADRKPADAAPGRGARVRARRHRHPAQRRRQGEPVLPARLQPRPRHRLRDLGRRHAGQHADAMRTARATPTSTS